MKLQELDALNKQDKAAQVLEKRLGQTVSFNNLSLRESRHLLMRVRSLINEHRNSVRFHSSENDPAYLKLIMIEEGLKGRLTEAPVAPMPGTPGAAPGQAAVNPAQMGMDIAKAKKAKQDQMKQIDDQIKALQQQKTQVQQSINQPNLGMAESRRRLRESEIQQAQVVLAAQDMVDQVQKMLEQISAMQFKDLPALTDSIKNDMGVDQATAYQSAAAAALTQLLQSVQAGKIALEGAQGTLTGQAPVVPGAEPAGDVNAEPAIDADIDIDAEIAEPSDEEEPTPLGAPEALGRERRVSEAAKADKKKNPFAKAK